MSLTAAEIRNQIIDQQFARIPFVLDQSKIDPVIKTLFAFFALPDETKNRFAFRLIPEDRGTEVGYWTRSRAEGSLDNRGYFHYNEYADERFRVEAADCPELISFMDAVRPLFLEAQDKMKEVVRTLDVDYPGLYDNLFPSDRHPLVLLRLLAYERMEPGDFLAKGHYDRGTCTLAIAESAPGLRIGKGPEDIKEVTREPNTALFFPGLTFNEYTSPEFIPSWHDVIQKEEYILNEQTARWAIVLFNGCWTQRNMSWQEAHDPKY
jgi:isopenicillin N synthase-like dioxygenase